MTFLRAVEEVTRRNKIRNGGIRNRLGVEHLQLKIEKQLSWFGNLVRMQGHRRAKEIREMEPGKKHSWNGQVAKILGKKGSNRTKAKLLAHYKKR